MLKSEQPCTYHIPVYTNYNPHNLITTNPVNNVAIEAHKAHTTYNLHNLITANPVNNVTTEAHNDDDINNIICYYTNVQSLSNKYDDILSTVVEEKKAKIIGISETWCHPDIEDYEIALPGYTIFRKDRTVRIGGGVLLYVSEELSCQPVNIILRTRFGVKLSSIQDKYYS